MINKKTVIQFTILTFFIAYLMSGILIVLGQFGFSVHSSVQESLRHLETNIPFAIYILSPAIVSYIVLIKSKIVDFKGWLKTVFYIRNSIFVYFFVIAGLVLYFGAHIAVSGWSEISLPFYMFFLNLPGNLVIGGLEEAGWMYILQPALDKRYGFVLSSFFCGITWLLWHVPLFFIPGTNHYAGIINFGMFAIQIMAFRFFYGAIYRISGKGSVFMGVLFHTMFNSASNALGIPPATWTGTVAANGVVVLVSIVTVAIYKNR